MVVGDGGRRGLLNHDGAHCLRGTWNINSLAGKEPQLMQEVKRDKLHQHNIFLCLVGSREDFLFCLPPQWPWVRGVREGLGTLASFQLSVIVLELSLGVAWLTVHQA